MTTVTFTWDGRWGWMGHWGDEVLHCSYELQLWKGRRTDTSIRA